MGISMSDLSALTPRNTDHEAALHYGKIRETLGAERFDLLERRVIDHACDVLMLGGHLQPIRDHDCGEVLSYTLHYPNYLGARIASQAIVTAGRIARGEV